MSDATRSSHLFCPHLQEVDNRTLQQLFSKVAAVRSQNRDLFDFTHRQIEVFRTSSSQDQVVTEDDVYEQFNEDRLKNFAVVIEGEVGTGKSELCAYLAHRLQDDSRPILHIDKEDDLMTLLSDRLPEFYREQFGEEMEGAADFQQLREDIESIPQVVANSAVSNTILNLGQRGYGLTITEGQEDDIRDFIRDKLQLLVESGEYATEITFVSKQEYQQNEFLQIFTDTSIEKAVGEYNEELWRVVRNRYETASLSDVLKRVGSKFTDTRPVIVFEDFSITAMEANKLAKFIESDSTENAWDFIIAGTRDSTDPLHTQTAESRYEFYQTNEADSQSVLFLDQDTAVNFVRPYLGYFKSFEDSVRYDRDREEGTFDLLPAPPESRCGICGFCDESFRDLFPFNEQFLRRVFVGMEEDQRSPREYIMAVFDVLSDYYEGKITVPSNAQTLKPLVNRISVADSVFEEAESFAHLARWYGTLNGADETIEVDRRFAEAFGLVQRSDENDDLPRPIKATQDVINIPSSGASTVGLEPTSDDDDGGKTSPISTTTDPIEEEFNEQAPLIESWLNAPGKFKQTAQYLERGLEDAIDYLTDGYSIYEGTSLEYNLSSQKRPFVFSITEDTAEEDQIVIDPHEFRLSDLRSVLRFGIEREKRPRSADYEELFEKTGTQITGYARTWRELIREGNLQKDDILYKGNGQYDFTDFVLAAYSYVVMLDSPWKPLSADTLCERYGNKDYDIDVDIRPWLKSELEHEEYASLEDLVEAAPQLEMMAGELFGVSGSDLDKVRIRNWFERTSPHGVLSMLGRTYIGNINTRVRFADGPKVRDLANTGYDVRSALDEVGNRYQQDAVEDISSNLGDISMTKLNQIISKLDTYDVHPDVMEPLKQFNQLDQSVIDDAVAAASTATSLHGGTKFESLQASLASAKLAKSAVYERYEAVPLNSGSGQKDIGRAFTEVAEHYVN